MRALTLIALAASGCIVIEQGQPVTVPCCDTAQGAELTTLSAVDDLGLALSLTDTTGPLACALAEDDELELGTAGTQLFLRVDPGWFIGCDDSVATLGGQACTPGDGVPIGCGRLRTWDARGRLVREQWVTSGAVVAERTPTGRCRFEIEAVLPGGEVIAGEASTEELDFWGTDAVCNTL